jgi:hypothetical protein
MFQRTRSFLLLALTLAVLSMTAHADGTTPPQPPPASPSSVTGGSPEPTSPCVVGIVLSLLHLT